MEKGLTYIILAAGIGKKLYPLTLDYSKMSFKIDEENTILRKMVKNIRDVDNDAEIVIVLGYQADKIKNELSDENVTFIINPFYAVTNSIASLWFAKEYLERQNVVILYGDILFENKVIEEILSVPTKHPYLICDTVKTKLDSYNVVVDSKHVIAMGRNLEKYNASCAYATKLDAVSCRLLKFEIDNMINKGMYNLFYEDALLQMIMFDNFELFYKDIKDYKWTEINTIDDLISAKSIIGGQN